MTRLLRVVEHIRSLAFLIDNRIKTQHTTLEQVSPYALRNY